MQLCVLTVDWQTAILALQNKLPSTVLLANSLSEANGMAATPLHADVVGSGLYATAELLAGNRFK